MKWLRAVPVKNVDCIVGIYRSFMVVFDFLLKTEVDFIEIIRFVRPVSNQTSNSFETCFKCFNSIRVLTGLST